LEVLESSEAVQARALREAALQYFCGLVLPVAVNDPGIGDSRAKAVIDSALKGKLLYRSADYFSLELVSLFNLDALAIAGCGAEISHSMG
jgi:hypothetical protein